MLKLIHKKYDNLNDFQTLCCDENWQITNLNFRAKNYKLFLQIFFDVLKMTNKEELKHFLGERQCESLARMGYLMNKNESFSIQQSQKSMWIIQNYSIYLRNTGTEKVQIARYAGKNCSTTKIRSET